jgi:hypothetical protein
MIHAIPSSQAARMLLSDWRMVKRWMALIAHSLDHFFLPQYRSLLWPRHRRVATLAHPLDRYIPFRPREVVTYLGYIAFYFKTLRWFYDRLGPAALPDIRESMDEVLLLYREAGAVYRSCQSTTSTRAPLPRHPYFAVIYLLDPHLACIPSLHILLICYNHLGAARILRRHGLRGEEAERLLEAVRSEARRITEAILLVKQHSLVDLAPTLFLLTALFPEYGREVVEDFIGGLFADWQLPGAIVKRLRALLWSSYSEFLEEWEKKGRSGHREMILEFLGRYIPGGRAGRISNNFSSTLSNSPRKRAGS